jgi:hypothetical protein
MNRLSSVIVFFILLSSASASEYQAPRKPAGIPRSQPLTTRSLSEIKRRLHQVAQRRLRQTRGVLTPEAAQFLSDTLDGGAARVYADGASSELIRKAENNTIELIDELVEDAFRRGSRYEMNKETVRKAWRRLCPLYPFC